MNFGRHPVAVCVLLLCVAADAADDSAWTETLERISSGVVSIRIDSTRAFDTEWNSSSQATGFVVDAERGIILTNRHVVTPGPVIAEAVFRNNEEVRLTPVYRDPVHDFGFFRYDPAELRYIKPVELPLDPNGAGIGREIRVVGNDAGEQLSILAGTIARLDRKAPEYGRGKYNDFNTFYLQAASGTSGGSSGSPVVSIDGRVVALNAGANNSAASSFFLPLDRIDRALKELQRGLPVARGTLQTTFQSKAYDELRRLGLTADSERLARSSFPKQTGMLVVDQVIPDSPAALELAPGDILIRINGELITQFVPLEAILDSHVGEHIDIELERGGRQIIAKVRVDDLHAITPDEYLEFGDAIVNRLSYQQARHYNRPANGVYVANPGYLLSKAAIPRGAVIVEVDGEDVLDLDDFEAVLDGLANGERARVRYVTMENPQNSIVRLLEMDRIWFPTRRCKRDDVLGLWPCRDLAEGPAPEPVGVSSTRLTKYRDPIVRAIAPSLVVVNFDLPYTLSGVSERHYYGTGLIVDKERGYVLVDRNTVPIAIGDVTVTFAGSLEVPGKIEQLHPLHNFAIVSYDPKSIGTTPVKEATFDTSTLKPGDDVWVVGIKADHQLVHQKSTVSSVDPLILPLSRTLRFRDSNIEGISLVNAPNDVDGVLVDKKGRVAATWSSFMLHSGGDVAQLNRGIGSEVVRSFVETVREGRPFYSLEAEFVYAPLFAARKMGVDEKWVARLEENNPVRRRALSITRVVAGTPAAKLLKNGDMVLAIDGNVVTSYRALEQAVQKPEVVVTVWRNDTVHEIAVQTAALDGLGIDRAISWAGALLQNPHRAMAAQRGVDTDGVYVAYFSYGSPSTRYGLWAGRRVVEVNETSTPNLQAFVDAVKDIKHRESVRLKTVTWNGTAEVITLKLDNQYWPAYEIRRTKNGWRRTDFGS
ncbi:MAG: trypsin-like peptidase domain-containing protein [Gammaproteobacteria bacterium]|nr:trypsin-like peptidase domain-containing protein [Gammaproteobacteria bacterium]NND48218.1 PDZ domain-containing protein [Woeseiaceae bacterium]NNL43831.1 PDZ domain-containing protein [Woeseiaceae bacterium]